MTLDVIDAEERNIHEQPQDKEHYAEIYARYLRNEAQSEAAKAMRAGRPF